MTPIKLLLNLPPGFYRTPQLAPWWERFAALGETRQRSHNTADEIASDLAWAEAVLMWSWPPLDDALLDQAPGLRFAAQLDIGQRAAKVALERGFPVSVARGGFSPAVAEMALGLVLSGLRKITAHQHAMRVGGEPWVGSFPDDIDPDERELTGARVGLIGYGGVGRRLAQLLAPFDCDLRLYDPYVTDPRCVELPELLAKSQVVVLCAASNPGTRALLGAEQLALLEPGALLVNVARAALVDTPALLARLTRGDLYAALDVFDHEPLEAGSPLRGLPNVWLTPHRAGGILSSVERLLGSLHGELVAFFDGGERRLALHANMVAGLDA